MTTLFTPVNAFVADLLARNETPTTLNIFHDYLLDHFPNATHQISFLRELIEDGGKWGWNTDFTLEEWQTHHLQELIMGSFTRNTFQITNKKPYGNDTWFTWKEAGHTPEDTSYIPLEIMKFLPGWEVEEWIEDDSCDKHWAWATPRTKIRNPNIALNLACYNWAVSSLRQFFLKVSP